MAPRMCSPNNLCCLETISVIHHLLQAVLSPKESAVTALSLATWQFRFCEFQTYSVIVTIVYYATHQALPGRPHSVAS